MPKPPHPTPFANRTQTGWWIFGEIQQWRPTKTKSRSLKRSRVWENTRLLKAANRDQAHRKALRLASAGMPIPTDGGAWHFLGLSFLLPIYEPLNDGAELLWQDHGSIGPAKLKRLVKAKDQLAVFAAAKQ